MSGLTLGTMTGDELESMTVGELLSMLVPGQENWDHRAKVEEVLEEVLGKATWFYDQHDDFRGCALNIARCVLHGGNWTAKAIADDMAYVADEMLNASGIEMSTETRDRLKAIYATRLEPVEGDPDYQGPVETPTEADHA
jgi:hypothetical protein